MYSYNLSSTLIVFSGLPLKCHFRILRYWFSSSPSLFTSFLMQYSVIKSPVSATMAHCSLWVSKIHFLNMLFLSVCLMHGLVSLLCWISLLGLYHQSNLILLWMYFLRFDFFSRGYVLLCFWCLFNMTMLALVGFVAVLVFRAASAQCVAWCRSSFLAIF